jgi:hypothetical protein
MGSCTACGWRLERECVPGMRCGRNGRIAGGGLREARAYSVAEAFIQAKYACFFDASSCQRTPTSPLLCQALCE